MSLCFTNCKCETPVKATGPRPWRGIFTVGSFVADVTVSPPQALPYVALLIVMLFFIYAVIGMQVSCHHVTLFPQPLFISS